MEDAGIDPATSRMLSERSTIWANPPVLPFFCGEISARPEKVLH